MKLTNRARAALAAAGYAPENSPAIAQLVAFAAQNSDIDPRNYFDPGYDRDGSGRRAYGSEARSISKAWREFKDALTIAGSEGVTDADVIAEAPHAYSGRLEWKPQHYNETEPGVKRLELGRWDYCTGQYFPTEYRVAARVLLEYATSKIRRERPAQTQAVKTISELKALNKRNGGHWFDKSTMSFFNARVESEIIRGRYFVTSEQYDADTARKYSVRSFDAEGGVDTVGEFQAYDTKRDALAAVPREESK